MQGTPGVDFIVAVADDQRIIASGGHDQIGTLAEGTTIDGGEGNDLLYGHGADVQLEGGPGSDLLVEASGGAVRARLPLPGERSIPLPPGVQPALHRDPDRVDSRDRVAVARRHQHQQPIDRRSPGVRGDPIRFTGTATGFGASSATNWSDDPTWYQIVLHCTSDPAYDTNLTM